jgi:hypothetical protein
MIEKAFKNENSFHLAGIVPVAGQPLDFNFPWHDSLQPIGKDYLAVERAIWECACAGCETIWVVCHDDMQPLIKYRTGEYIYDPVDYIKVDIYKKRVIPIYYVPIHHKDRDRRDCLGWSVLHGAQSAYWLSRTISQWVIPDRFYVAFPYGVYDPDIVKPHRKVISSDRPFFISNKGKTVKDNEYLGFTFNGEDFKACRRTIRKEGTGQFSGEDLRARIPIEKRWSARSFSLDKVFQPVTIEGANVIKAEWYHNIDNWRSLCTFLGSEDCTKLQKPEKKLFDYHEWNPIGTDNEKR